MRHTLSCYWSFVPNMERIHQELQMLQGGHEKVNGQTDRRTDGQTDRQTGWIQYTPPNFVAGGIIMDAVRQRHLILWRFWKFFVITFFNTNLFSHVIIGIDHGWSGVMTTTPSWYVVWQGCPLSCSLGMSMHPVVAVTPSRLWSIP